MWRKNCFRYKQFIKKGSKMESTDQLKGTDG